MFNHEKMFRGGNENESNKIEEAKDAIDSAFNKFVNERLNRDYSEQN